MNANEWIQSWKAEEEIAHIHGWDFSHIHGRYTEQDDLPWDYRAVIEKHLTPDMKILDIDTGGGEFLLSLNHPHENTAAMENFPPNVALCQETLLPLGIDFRPGDGKGKMPFDDGCFDLVINRHGDFNAEEIYRVLKPGGVFITQQVGAENDRELAELLCGVTESPFPGQYLNIATEKFENAGFAILQSEEAFRPIRFFDVGALVWFARIIQWEFPDFSVDTHLDRLLSAQNILETQGSVDGSIHRFLLAAQK
ncbi:MAG: methyltransferase domain-containing protein [Clostridia bacterium]|nr:methyltransferase domain-containing protein [Clostridia bacterium]